MRDRDDLPVKGVVIIVVIMVLVCGILFLAGNHFYLFNQVAEGQFGVQMRSGRVTGVVGPGVYSDWGWYADMRVVSTAPVNFTVEDPEIITRDSQRLGLKMSADAVRPRNADKIQELWGQRQAIFTDDAALATRLVDFGQQAMKVCVGGNTFTQNVVGAGRDELRNCIDTELSDLASGIGIEIENVVVPNIILSPEVQAALDAIVQSRLATEKEAQEKLRADAAADTEQARQEGEVRVTQARAQEEARQQAIFAKLEADKVTAQKALVEAQAANDLAQAEAQEAVITAQKSNELLKAQRDLEIAEVIRDAALVRAEAEKAPDAVIANLMGGADAYAAFLLSQQQAQAMQGVEKIMIVPQGTNPQIIVPGPALPTLSLQP